MLFSKNTSPIKGILSPAPDRESLLQGKFERRKFCAALENSKHMGGPSLPKVPTPGYHHEN
jgi:hypothetical protein